MNPAQKLFNLMSEPARSMIEGATVSTYERTIPHDSQGHLDRAAAKRQRKAARHAGNRA